MTKEAVFTGTPLKKPPLAVSLPYYYDLHLGRLGNGSALK